MANANPSIEPLDERITPSSLGGVRPPPDVFGPGAIVHIAGESPKDGIRIIMHTPQDGQSVVAVQNQPPKGGVVHTDKPGGTPHKGGEDKGKGNEGEVVEEGGEHEPHHSAEHSGDHGGGHSASHGGGEHGGGHAHSGGEPVEPEKNKVPEGEAPKIEGENDQRVGGLGTIVTFQQEQDLLFRPLLSPFEQEHLDLATRPFGPPKPSNGEGKVVLVESTSGSETVEPPPADAAPAEGASNAIWGPDAVGSISYDQDQLYSGAPVVTDKMAQAFLLGAGGLNAGHTRIPKRGDNSIPEVPLSA